MQEDFRTEPASNCDGAEQQRTEPPFIVGIGASAGGLEALERFFRAVPGSSAMAFVVVQHLSPDFRSLMHELLARHTAMPIHRVRNGISVEGGSIYLIPPRKDMIIAGGRLLLTDKDPQQDLSLPIDHFFRSLAQEAGTRAAAIVLSGTGSDGSRGIRDVHQAGGLVLAQSAETAQFDGMPKSALDTGVVDAVLAPEDMPAALAEHAVHPALLEVPPTGDQSDLDAIFKILRHEHGIDFSDYKPNTVGRRIERRRSLVGAPDIPAYLDRLRSDADERSALYRDLLIGVTRFFRDREAFDRLEREVVPEIVARKAPGEEIRVWVAGCATGEEAYSIAMLIDERLRLVARRTPVKVFASDVHRASLEIASAGVYGEDKLGDVSEPRRDRYFVRKPNGFHVTSELRKMVVFATHNLVTDAPFTKLDLITCRNLLIYLQQPVQKKVLSLFHFGLRTGGILFLGPSETPGDLAPEFEDVDPHWKVYRKRRDVRLSADLRLPLSSSLPLRWSGSVAAGSGGGGAGMDPALLAAYDRLLETHMPPGVLVSEQRALVHSFGDTAPYLRVPRGRASNDLLDLVHEDLRLPLAGALQRAAKERAPVVHRGVPVSGDATGALRVDLKVEPVLDRQSNLTHHFVSFSACDTPPPSVPEPTEIGTPKDSSALVSTLESELRYARENLQATIEELETSNEELQASNEELVASNEELQSTNEELHSVNQELYTVNAEYQRKILELTELTDDMDNLLRSTDIGTIFLDRDLCIRKFTPQIARAFDLLPHDVGRRIDSFSHHIDHDGLLDDLAAVVRDGTRIEREVQDRHGNSLLLRVLPYRSRSALAGAVLSLVDVSLLKRAEARLEQLSAIVASSEDAIVGAHLDGRIATWNRGAELLYGWTADEVVGLPLSTLHLPGSAEHRPDWTPECLARMRRGEPTGYQVETVRRHRDGRPIEVLLSCSGVRDSVKRLTGVSLIARDVSERRRAERLVAERARLAALRAEIGLSLASDEDLDSSLASCARALVTHLDATGARLWLASGDGALELRASAGGDLPREVEGASGGAVTVPLAVADRVVGVLGLFVRADLAPAERETLETIALEIAQCSERKRAEESLRIFAEELASTNQELRATVSRCELAEQEANAAVDRRDRYLAILSHELRNPLAAILSAADLLELAGVTDEAQGRARGAIARQARQMARLLDDLLDVSRITRNKIEIHRQPIDICEAAREAVELVRASLDARGHRLHTDLCEGPVYIDGDPARLQQIQVNLLTNAIKYTPPGGDIWMDVGARDGEAVLRVRDSGPGIPPEMRERVFDLFVQLEGAVGKSDGGMGVGLTLVRALVELHGGEIAVREPEDGRGSVFEVRLPLTARPSAGDVPPPPERDLAGLRFLLIEDNQDIRTTTVELLATLGCQVTAAEDGRSGIAAFARARPDVALIDIGMPDLSGYEVARRLRASADGDGAGVGSSLLIALTGFGQDEDRSKALAAGFDAHMVKPIDLAQLGATLRHLRR